MLVYHWLLAFVDYGLFMCCYVSLCIMYTWLVIISISVTIVIISRIISSFVCANRMTGRSIDAWSNKRRQEQQTSTRLQITFSISIIRQGDRAPRTRGTLNLPGVTTPGSGNCSTTPSTPIKSFPIKSLWVKLSGRFPINFNGHENSHPLELESAWVKPSEVQTLSSEIGRTPGLHNKIPALKIFARGWVAQESMFVYTINANSRDWVRKDGNLVMETGCSILYSAWAYRRGSACVVVLIRSNSAIIGERDCALLKAQGTRARGSFTCCAHPPPTCPTA